MKIILLILLIMLSLNTFSQSYLCDSIGRNIQIVDLCDKYQLDSSSIIDSLYLQEAIYNMRVVKILIIMGNEMERQNELHKLHFIKAYKLKIYIKKLEDDLVLFDGEYVN